MLYVEVNVPEGHLSLAERRRLATMLATEDLAGPGEADPGVLALHRSLTHVVVREADVWVAGGRHADLSGRARYLVTVHAGPWAAERAGRIAAAVTRRIEDFDGDADALRFGGRCLVHVVGVQEGGLAAFGEVLTAEGLAADAAPVGRALVSHVPG
ncbi:hypothetical protein [Phytomonospora endophytica]|uniref:Uncharacterized protein n=1 Tax=Phytomonospora endophytica TaxID=714109 RepID=A0A841G3R1_9ACTN|nr:hypothetical protein [Phytomonospora endophytica]MBB6038750.1 hypothetical protein [Phytomonospora endophytica]GIG68454.1 hypothetical protein Pen01_47490 [Phytomonospora endophytica]